jgi:hypothetical protein
VVASVGVGDSGVAVSVEGGTVGVRVGWGFEGIVMDGEGLDCIVRYVGWGWFREEQAENNAVQISRDKASFFIICSFLFG